MKTIILFIVALALGLMWYEKSHSHSEIRDSKEYVDLALNLENKGLHYAGAINSKNEVDMRLYSKRTPAYPIFLGINSNQDLSIFRFLQLGLLLVIFLVGLIFMRELGYADRKSLLFYSLLNLVNVPIFFTLTFQLSDLLLATVMAVSALCFYRFLKSKNSKLLNYCSLLLSIGVLTKPVLWPMIVIWCVYLLISSRKQKLGAINILPAMVIVLFSWINYHNTGVFHFSSISSINKAQYNGKLMVAQSQGIDSVNSFMNKDGFAVPVNPAEFKTYCSSMDELFYSELRKNPIAYLKVHITGIIKMLIDPGRYEIYTFLGAETATIELTPLLYAGKWKELFNELQKHGFAFYLLVILSVLSILKLGFAFLGLFKSGRSFLIVTLAISIYFLGITGPVGAYRFAIPLQLFLIILASIGLSNTLKFFQKGSE